MCFRLRRRPRRAVGAGAVPRPHAGQPAGQPASQTSCVPSRPLARARFSMRAPASTHARARASLGAAPMLRVPALVPRPVACARTSVTAASQQHGTRRARSPSPRAYSCRECVPEAWLPPHPAAASRGVHAARGMTPAREARSGGRGHQNGYCWPSRGQSVAERVQGVSRVSRHRIIVRAPARGWGCRARAGQIGAFAWIVIAAPRDSWKLAMEE